MNNTREQLQALVKGKYFERGEANRLSSALSLLGYECLKKYNDKVDAFEITIGRKHNQLYHPSGTSVAEKNEEYLASDN